MHATIHQVADAAGVSISTVSRALSGRGRVAERTRRRVARLAHELGYHPNDLARSLLAQSTQTIAVVVPSITNPFFPELVEGIERVAAARGHLLLLCDSADDHDRVWRDLAALRRRRVDGMILVGPTLDPGRLAAVTRGVPVVTVDRGVPLAEVSVVTSDHAHGSRLAVDHLVGLGHRRIALFRGSRGATVSRSREQGFWDAMAAHGLSVDERLVLNSGFTEDEGAAAADRLLAGPAPTAVVAANDLNAIGAIAAFERAGVRVPADMSVVGFDDIHLARYVRPRLTTIHQDIRGLGARAAELLIDDLLGEAEPERRHEELAVRLVIRESTGPAPSSPQQPRDQQAEEGSES